MEKMGFVKLHPDIRAEHRILEGKDRSHSEQDHVLQEGGKQLRT